MIGIASKYQPFSRTDRSEQRPTNPAGIANAANASQLFGGWGPKV
jgi:hypothetical protein